MNMEKKKQKQTIRHISSTPPVYPKSGVFIGLEQRNGRVKWMVSFDQESVKSVFADRKWILPL